MMDRKQELKKIIADAQAELDELNKPLTWEEACKYMHENIKDKMQVVSNYNGGIYHSYEGIGILYTLHALEGKTATYKIR